MQQRSTKSGKYSPFMRGLSLISSIGMLSSGMVWAQTQTLKDIDPAAYETPQTVEVVSAPEKKEEATPPPLTLKKAKLEATEIAPAPVWEETNNNHTQPESEIPSAAAPTWESTEPNSKANPAEETTEETAIEEGWAPEVAAPPEEQPQTPKQPQLLSPTPEPDTPEPPATANAQTFEDYNNLYIDPSSYSMGSISGYEEPNTVILSERSTGTEVIVSIKENSIGETVGENTNDTTVVISQSHQPQQALAPANSNSIEKSSPPTETYSQYNAIAVKAETLPVFSTTTPKAPLNPQPPLPVPIKALTPPAVPAYSQLQPLPKTLEQYPAPAQQHYEQQVSPTPLESVSDSGIGLNTQQNPPASAFPLPSGFYYQNILPRRATSVPGNGNTQLLFPLTIPAVITSVFGWRIHPITGDNSFHSGTDLAAPMGTPVLAAYDGKVTTANYLGGYGLTVILEHDNGTRETLYAHLADVFVKPGDNVPQGSVIGTVGSTGNSTGPHLHFELRELTAKGWVIVDAGAQLEHALAQLVKALQTAQSNSKPKAS